MRLKGKLGAAAAVLVTIFGLGLCGSGCGEYYRPVAIPVPQPGGDPQPTRHALVVSSNGAQPGSAVVIDVSGDDAVAVFSGINGLGQNPVYAIVPTGTDYVVDQGSDNVAFFTLASIGQPNLITLPAGAAPVFAASAPGKLFVAEHGRNKVAVIELSTNSLSTEIPVGSNPVALVATPDGSQLYCLNQGDNTVTVILPANNTVFTAIPVGASPVWGAASNDSTRVFVANQGSSTVSVIDTATDTVVNTKAVGAGPNYITYDPMLNRAYVTSPPDGSISIIENATAVPPAVPTVTKVPLASPSPCNGTTPISITALADGTRAYVADQAGNSVCILNTTSNTFTKRICLVQAPAVSTDPCVAGAAPAFIASDSNSFRVYTANQFQTAAFAISSISRQNITNPVTGVVTGLVTVITTSSVPFQAGQPVTISDVQPDTSFNGVFGITSVTASNQFTFIQNGIVNSAAATGKAAVLPYLSLIQTANDSLVPNDNEATDNASLNLITPPLTIDAGGTPTFIVMTPF